MTASAKRSVDDMVARGLIGGRTVQIIDTGAVECVEYPVPDVPDGSVRIATVQSAISPGTEMTFYGRHASNVYLHKRWDEDLRLFVTGPPSIDYPLTFGYRAAGEVVESRDSRVAVGQRVYGNWRHTEYIVMPGDQALAQALPDGLTWDDGVDIGQMGPICVNAVAYGQGRHAGGPAVVFGAGPVGLITSQIVAVTGAERVVVVDRIPWRLANAASLGLETLDAGTTDDVAADLKRRFGSEGIAVAWECTGSAAALHDSIRVVRRRGTVVAAGFYQGGATPLMLGDEFHHNGVQVTSGQIGNVHPTHTWATLRRRTIELRLADSIRLGTLPRTTFAVDEVASGFEALGRPAEILQVALSYGR